MALQAPLDARPNRNDALLAPRFAAFRVGRWKLLATAVQEKWQSRKNANRIRLIATRFTSIFLNFPT